MSSRVMLAAARPARGIFVLGRRDAQGRGFQISTTRASGLKESSQEDPESEKHKQDSLNKQRQGKGHWKPELASDSEEAIKADRNSSSSPSELAEKTKSAAEEARKAGTSPKDNM